MISPFNKLGLAVTFSPNGIALLKETIRLKNLFDAKVVLIHIGRKNDETEKELNRIIEEAGLIVNDTEIIWESGDPAAAILKYSNDAGVDLLISGALEKETLIKYYVGSVARKIMRESHSSVLILKSPSLNPAPFKKFYVSADYSEESASTIKKAYSFALLEEASEFVILKDYDIPGLSSTIVGTGGQDQINEIKSSAQIDEEEKMKFFIKELNLKGLDIKMYCLYGKEGFQASNFAKENKADILVMNAPPRKYTILDRIFPHEQEFSFAKLPANLLIIR